jgi:hypothetical protein
VGEGKDKSMEGMFVKQILQLRGWIDGKKRKNKKKTGNRKDLVGMECHSPNSPRVEHPSFFAVGRRETAPSFSRRIPGSN